MSIERKIYSSWAFSENEKEKAQMNRDIFQEFKGNGSFFRQWEGHEADEQTLKDKFVFEYAGNGYAHTKYHVVSNPKNLSQLEMALICDNGNLCFGYRVQNGLIVIHTD